MDHVDQYAERNLTVSLQVKDIERLIADNAKKPDDYAFALRSDITSLKELRVAAIMDGFTFTCYNPECQILELSPENCIEEIQTFQPDILFIESVWQGKDGLWSLKVSDLHESLYRLIGYCRGMQIPVILWNKEDPVHTASFMHVAKLCDYVFTTDVDCVSQYKQVLGHNRVYVLPFAAQPAIHNPIEQYERKNKICFAGTYYKKYPERRKLMDAFTDFFVNREGIDIYDRHYGENKASYIFPETYEPYILGKLEPHEISLAYKGYVYGLNMNSITQSQTMFARRVFELMASNTIVVGNYSRGTKNFFGDLTLCTDNMKYLEKQMDRYCADKTVREKYRLLGLRKVLSEHLYEDRLDQIVKTVFNVSLKSHMPHIYVLADNSLTVKEKKRIVAQYDQQVYPYKELCWYEHDQSVIFDDRDAFCTMMMSDDYYGPNYLYDLAFSTRYSDLNGFVKPQNAADAYRPTNELFLRCSIVRASHLAEQSFAEIQASQSGHFLFIDPFNYAEKAEGAAWADDLVVQDTGISLNDVTGHDVAEGFGTMFGAYTIKPDRITKIIRFPKEGRFACELGENRATIRCKQQPHQTSLIELDELLNIHQFSNSGRLLVQMLVYGNPNATGVCWFYGKNKEKLSIDFYCLNDLQSVTIPPFAAYFKLGFFVKGPMVVSVKRAVVSRMDSLSIDKLLLRSDILLLSNFYPSPDDLYKHMYVHRRVLGYKERNLLLDIMLMSETTGKYFREYEGINILEGNASTIDRVMKDSNIRTICIHFLYPGMWRALKPYLGRVRLVIWAHGSDIHPWQRRAFNYTTQTELQRAKKVSANRVITWKEAFEASAKYPIHFVFVSQSLADEVFEDYEVSLPSSAYSIIHNVIDTDLFVYKEKEAEQRKKIISIRPFSNYGHGNDMTVSCILTLSKKECFADMSFHIIGDGPLFDETTAPLKGFPNVKVEKKFVTPDEMASLFQENGIFLTPTRSDTQGVSRDEAMACGMVPVSNAVCAIPEFTDQHCAILAPGEDYEAMANGIEQLYDDPNMFLEMSRNAAARVRRQSGKEQTVDKEVALIKRINEISEARID